MTNFCTHVQAWFNDFREKHQLESPLGSELICFPTIGSTNTYVKQNNELPSGTIVIAEEQTAGRGQRARKWVSNPGGLYVTFKLIFPIDQIISPFWVQTAISLGAVSALEELKLNASIKWPNDILINKKKCSGILGESITTGSHFIIIIGIGININNDISQILTNFPNLEGKITSVIQETQKIDLLTIFGSILRSLDYYWAHNFPINELRRAWMSHSHLPGSLITVRDLSTENIEKVKVMGINDHGSLLVVDEDKKEKEINVGDIEFLIEEKN